MIIEQADETWLKQFKSQISTGWDFTAIHINKNNLDGVKKDVVRLLHPAILIEGTDDDNQDHYWNTYKKPIWVTEFACVDGEVSVSMIRGYPSQA
jgi:hypothetical protein